jgi:hypothetical protein
MVGLASMDQREHKWWMLQLALWLTGQQAEQMQTLVASLLLPTRAMHF